MLIRTLLLLLMLLMPVLGWAAGGRVVILADDNPVNRQVQRTVEAELRRVGVTQIFLADTNETPTGRDVLAATDVVLAVGLPALRQVLQQTGSRRMAAVLVTRSGLEAELAKTPLRSGRELHAIVLDQPVGRYFDLIRLALPQSRRVGLLSGASGRQSTLTLYRGLEKQAEERGMKLSLAQVADDSTSGFIARLEELLEQCDVLLALPDADIHNRTTVQPLLLTTYRAGIPVMAYSEAYGRAGALLALYSTPDQLAQQASETVQQILQGRHSGALVVHLPKYFSVSVNATVARSLGLAISSGIVLQERLRQREPINE